MHKQLTEKEKKVYESVITKHKNVLLGYDGVRDVGYGYPSKNGDLQTDRVSILVFVVRKFSEKELLNEQIIPKTLEGIPVDVIESNPVEHAETLADPLIGGIGISNVNLSGRGTLGVVVRKKNSSNVVWGLTNWHVIKRSRGKAGDAIVQPAWKPNTPEYCIGHLVNWNQELDCAVFELNSLRSHAGPTSLKNISGKIGGIVAPEIGMLVTKSGARTGVTYGFISFISENKSNVTISPNQQKPAKNNEISMTGDSGSLWVTDEAVPMAVALHRAGDKEGTRRKEYSYAKSIQHIADAMGFEF